MNGPMMAVLAWCGAMYVVGLPTVATWKGVAVGFLKWVTLYFFLWFILVVLYLEVVLEWLVF